MRNPLLYNLTVTQIFIIVLLNFTTGNTVTRVLFFISNIPDYTTIPYTSITKYFKIPADRIIIVDLPAWYQNRLVAVISQTRARTR